MSGDISRVIGGDFDGEGVEPSCGFDPVPAGWYTCEIESAQVLETKKKDGMYLKMVTGVVSEQFEGRKFFPTITLSNPNQMAVDIGRRNLEVLRIACQLPTIGDTTELVGKIIDVRVKIHKEEGRDPDNKVTTYRAIGDEKPSKPTAPKKAASAAAAPASDGAKRRPWER